MVNNWTKLNPQRKLLLRMAVIAVVLGGGAIGLVYQSLGGMRERLEAAQPPAPTDEDRRRRVEENERFLRRLTEPNTLSATERLLKSGEDFAAKAEKAYAVLKQGDTDSRRKLDATTDPILESLRDTLTQLSNDTVESDPKRTAALKERCSALIARLEKAREIE